MILPAEASAPKSVCSPRVITYSNINLAHQQLPYLIFIYCIFMITKSTSGYGGGISSLVCPESYGRSFTLRTRASGWLMDEKLLNFRDDFLEMGKRLSVYNTRHTDHRARVLGFYAKVLRVGKKSPRRLPRARSWCHFHSTHRAMKGSCSGTQPPEIVNSSKS